MHFHHVPLVAARPPDLLDRAKHLLDSANVGEAQGSPSIPAKTIRITIANAKTAQLEYGRYIDALQLSIGDIVSPLWTGVILVAANPRRAMLPP